MYDAIEMGYNAGALESAPVLDEYTAVRVLVDDETCYEAGSGNMVLEVSIPWGTQEIADNLLALLHGYHYQPYRAEKALIDPAAELGDVALFDDGTTGQLLQRTVYFGHLYSEDISAPADEELDHEYTFTSAEQRRYQRLTSHFESQLMIQSNRINAKVSEVGGDNTSFGWTLTSTGFILSSGSTEVFRCDANGIRVNGEVRAASGYIGNSTTGFTINATNLANGKTSYSETGHDGVYLGTDGIGLGKGKFYVDSQGNLTAGSSTFNGTVDVSGSMTVSGSLDVTGHISAPNLRDNSTICWNSGACVVGYNRGYFGTSGYGILVSDVDFQDSVRIYDGSIHIIRSGAELAALARETTGTSGMLSIYGTYNGSQAIGAQITGSGSYGGHVRVGIGTSYLAVMDCGQYGGSLSVRNASHSERFKVEITSEGNALIRFNGETVTTLSNVAVFG